MGLQGMVSKHRESTYRGGRSPRWIKVKNRHSRVRDQFGGTSNNDDFVVGSSAAVA